MYLEVICVKKSKFPFFSQLTGLFIFLTLHGFCWHAQLLFHLAFFNIHNILESFLNRQNCELSHPLGEPNDSTHA